MTKETVNISCSICHKAVLKDDHGYYGDIHDDEFVVCIDCSNTTLKTISHFVGLGSDKIYPEEMRRRYYFCHFDQHPQYNSVIRGIPR